MSGETQRPYTGTQCNVSAETNAWNKQNIAHANAQHKPYMGRSCNVSQKTTEWNNACLEFVRS